MSNSVADAGSVFVITGAARTVAVCVAESCRLCICLYASAARRQRAPCGQSAARPDGRRRRPYINLRLPLKATFAPATLLARMRRWGASALCDAALRIAVRPSVCLSAPCLQRARVGIREGYRKQKMTNWWFGIKRSKIKDLVIQRNKNSHFLLHGHRVTSKPTCSWHPETTWISVDT